MMDPKDTEYLAERVYSRGTVAVLSVIMFAFGVAEGVALTLLWMAVT